MKCKLCQIELFPEPDKDGHYSDKGWDELVCFPHDDMTKFHVPDNEYDPSVNYRQKVEEAGIPVTSTPTGFRLG
jgi:hypothetical protein